MFNRTTRSRQFALAACVGVIALAGCSGKRDRLAEFRENPTPELVTMNQRPDDVRNLSALIRNEQKRMLVRDWRYLWLLDRPTRLTPEPSAW